jgi:AcrR family transcriptional regulator
VTKAKRTREFISRQAAPLFNKRGFAGTSLGDLAEATGLTKGALYGNFRDKEGVALAAFRYAMRHIRTVVTERLDQEPSNRGKLIALFDFFAEYVMHPPIAGGCPMMNFGVEADDHQRFLRPAVAKEIRATIEFIQQCLIDGITAREFSRDTDVHCLSYLFFCAIEGAIVVSRVTGTAAPMLAVLEHCKRTLSDISRR